MEQRSTPASGQDAAAAAQIAGEEAFLATIPAAAPPLPAAAPVAAAPPAGLLPVRSARPSKPPTPRKRLADASKAYALALDAVAEAKRKAEFAETRMQDAAIAAFAGRHAKQAQVDMRRTTRVASDAPTF